MSRSGTELRCPHDLSPAQVAWLLLAIASLTALVRLRLLSVPLERDEGEYAYIGQLLLQGIPPYSGAYSMKLPGVPLCYAAFMTLFGQHALGIRLGLVIVNVATSFLVYLMARDLFSRWAGVAAAAVFSVLTLGSTVHGCIANAEHFVLLPALGGVWCLVRAATPGRRAIGVAGLCFGLAVIAKQHAAVFLVFGLAWILWDAFVTNRWARFPADLMILCAGPAVLYGLLCLWMWSAGIFDTFWLWTVTYPQAYVSQVGPSQAWEQFLATGTPIMLFSAPALALGTMGLVIAHRNEPRRAGAFLGLFAAFSALAVTPGWHFREHYFLLIVPAIALSFGAFIDWLAARLSANRRFGIVVGSVVAAVLWSVWCDRDVLFRLSPLHVSHWMYGSNPFPESPAIGEHIRETTVSSATVAVLGSEPQIPFYARRRSATGHIYMYPLTENQPFAEAMQRELVAQIEAAEPEIVVVVRTPTSWLLRPETPSYLFDWMLTYLDRHYTLDAVFDCDAAGRVIVLHGSDAANPANATPLAIKLLRRKP